MVFAVMRKGRAMAEFIFEIDDAQYNEDTGEVAVKAKAKEELVRCKDCKHHGYDRRDLPYCDINDYGYGWKDEDFCSYAERRQNDSV